MITKVCTKCHETKALSEFYFRKDLQRYRFDCKECVLRSRKSRYHTDVEHRKKVCNVAARRYTNKKEEITFQKTTPMASKMGCFECAKASYWLYTLWNKDWTSSFSPF